MKHLKTYEAFGGFKPTHWLLIFEELEGTDRYLVLDSEKKYKEFINKLEYKYIADDEYDMDFESIEDIIKDEFKFEVEVLEINEPIKNTGELFLSKCWEDYGEEYYSLADNEEALNTEILYNANESQKQIEDPDFPESFTDVEEAIKFIEDTGGNIEKVKITHTDYNETLKRLYTEIDAKKFNL